MKESKKRLISLIGTTSVVAVVAIGFTYSWMNNNTKGNAYNINLEVVRNNEMAISFDNTAYSHELREKTDGHTFAQVSGDGADFYSYVASLDTANAYFVSGYRQIPKENYNDFLLYKIVYFKADFPIKLHLDHTSFVSPADVATRRLYGFSRDYVAGAMRVGLAKYDENDIATPLLVWAPNSQYQYIDSPISFVEEGDVEDKYTIVRGSSEHDSIEVTTEGNTYGETTVNAGEYTLEKFIWGTPTEDKYLVDLPGGVTKMAFTVWLEGTDRECTSSLAGGHINVDIKFTCQNVLDIDY